MNENTYTNIIPVLGVKLATPLAILTLSLKIINYCINKDLVNDSYYLRTMIFFQLRVV